MGSQFGPRLLNDGLGILLGEVLEFAVARQSILNCVGLIAGNMPRDILTVLPGLKLVVGTLGTIGHEGQLASFHPFDLSDLLEELSRLE
jgi:hypothetical protein